jgi:hypothetical protein
LKFEEHIAGVTFNTLNSISWLAETTFVGEAITMLRRLGFCNLGFARSLFKEC